MTKQLLTLLTLSLFLAGCATASYQCGGNSVSNGDTMATVQQTCGNPSQYRRNMTQESSSPAIETDWLYPQGDDQALQLSFSQNKLIDGETMNMQDVGTGWQNFGVDRNLGGYAGQYRRGFNNGGETLQQERTDRQLDRDVNRQVNKIERQIFN